MELIFKKSFDRVVFFFICKDGYNLSVMRETLLNKV